MKQFYDTDEYFLVGDIETRKIYVINTFYKLLFKAKRPLDEFPCYLYLGKGVIKKESRHFIQRNKLDYAQELVSKKELMARKELMAVSDLGQNNFVATGHAETAG